MASSSNSNERGSSSSDNVYSDANNPAVAEKRDSEVHWNAQGRAWFLYQEWRGSRLRCDICGRQPEPGRDAQAWELRQRGCAGVLDESIRCGRVHCDPIRLAAADVPEGRPAEPEVDVGSLRVATRDDSLTGGVHGARHPARGARSARAQVTTPPDSFVGDSGLEAPRNALIRASVANARRIADHAMSLAMLIEEQPDIWGPKCIAVLERLERASAASLTVLRCELNIAAERTRAASSACQTCNGRGTVFLYDDEPRKDPTCRSCGGSGVRS